jgi:hypothetical protein
MATQKLTLSVDPHVVESAKRYAAAHGTSVSQLVEEFLAAVSAENGPSRITPVLARLRGALRGVSIEDHREHLAEKYR